MPEAAEAWDVYAGFAGKDHAGFKEFVVALVEPGRFMFSQADAVSRVMAEVTGYSVLTGDL